MAELAHPLIDEVVGGIAVSESRAPVLALTATRADLIVHAAVARHPLVFLTGDGTRLTESMRSALVATRVPWVVRTADGLRDGLSLRALADLDSAFGRGSGFEERGAAPHPDALYLERPTALQLVASVSVRHRANSTTTLGAATEAFARLAGAPAPATWGPNEPAEFAWDRTAMTAFARARMPRATRIVVAGDETYPLSAVVTAQRTSRGVEEITELLVSLGPVESDQTDRRVAAATSVLDELALPPWALMGLLFTRPGRHDLTTTAFLAPTLSPLALLLGAPAVRSLRVDVGEWMTKFAARAVGRAGQESLVVPLRPPTGPADAGWAPLIDIVESVGVERVAQLSGLRVDVDEWRRR